MLNETVPVYELGTYGILTQVQGCLGYLIILGMGIGLPQADYVPGDFVSSANLDALHADQEDSFWRVLYLLPVIVNAFMLLSFLILIKEDSIMYNISKGKYQEALNLIDKVYHPSEDREQILESLKSQCDTSN
jgi:hypothetical protein